ncbi:MAG: biotin--[acetyl-CoA-carboxylase] ligase [Proteobacteria bacterium]|nr:biotin--[acetyl-CoA-carboxylase] ligase [Pseudomonadota bacterium]
MKFQTRTLGHTFHHLPTTDSTQTYLKNLMQANEAPIGTLVLTDHQPAGKGTQGRTWFSLPKPQLMFSLLIQPNLPIKNFPVINVLSGILMAKSLEEFEVNAQVKWPNDIFIQGKKAGGILSELIDEKIVLGIGINTDGQEEDFPKELRSIATTVSLHGKVDRFDLLNSFLIRLEAALQWPANELISYCNAQDILNHKGPISF